MGRTSSEVQGRLGVAVGTEVGRVVSGAFGEFVPAAGVAGSQWRKGGVAVTGPVGPSDGPAQPLCCFLAVCGFVPEATWMRSQPWPPASLWPDPAMSLLSLAKRPGLGQAQ